MVKNQKRMIKSAKKKPRLSRAPKVIDADTLDEHAVGAMKMLYDPCGSDLAPSVYTGDRGYVNRFANAFNVANGATETCGILVQKPGVNVSWNIGDASAATAKLCGYSDTQAPGAGFFNSNASKIRCVGYCYTIRASGSINTATGQFYYGVVPSSSILAGTSYSVTDLIPLLTQSVTASQTFINPLEVKWSPGAFDDRYCSESGVTADDDTDRNSLVVIGIGLPAGSGFTVRATAIYEWTPKPSLGVTIDSTSVKPSRCDIQCVLRNLKRKDSNWWWALGTKTLGAVQKVSQGYLTGGVAGAAVAASRFL